MEGVIEAVIARLGDRRITRVRLAVGALAGVAIDALRLCFEACAHGTPLDGATLEIVSIEGRALCRKCGGEHPAPTLWSRCPCGSFDRELVAGHELRIVAVEVQRR
jgi:hydrogenase nickel incorporation protein HypA/HybF